jgi:hypothetical protein
LSFDFRIREATFYDLIRFPLEAARSRMSTFEAIVLGMMISWTPSVVVMAYFVWNASIEEGRF